MYHPHILSVSMVTVVRGNQVLELTVDVQQVVRHQLISPWGGGAGREIDGERSEG